MNGGCGVSDDSSAQAERMKNSTLVMSVAELGATTRRLVVCWRSVSIGVRRFFLMCYCFTNLACAVQTILRTPNWRPRYRYYHWYYHCISLAQTLDSVDTKLWYIQWLLAGVIICWWIYKYFCVIVHNNHVSMWWQGMLDTWVECCIIEYWWDCNCCKVYLYRIKLKSVTKLNLITWVVWILHITIDTQSINSNSSCHFFFRYLLLIK